MHPSQAPFLERAFELAERGRRTVSPNPLVGCVLVSGTDVVGEGWHERPGGPHAEVAALEAAAERARGATAYVTLEPCAHTGRTPACTTALVAAGVARVVAALADPNPTAAGGAAVLRAAGVPCEVDVAPERARKQNRTFLHGISTGRPFVLAKAAVSLDGRIAAADGTSRWLTGEAARDRAHALRAEVDAVVVGSGTVLADDPHLTVRLGASPAHDGPQPLRVVLDRRGRVRPEDGWRVLDGAAPTVVLDAGEPKAVLEDLWDRDVRSVLVEGGGAVLASFLAARLVDRLLVHVAPVLLGERGVPALRDDRITTIDAAPRFVLEEVERVGDDVLLELVPRDHVHGHGGAGERG